MTERGTAASRDRRPADRRADRADLDTGRGRASPAVPRPGEARRRDVGASARHTADNYQRIAGVRPDQRPDVSRPRTGRSTAVIASPGSSARSATDPQTTPNTTRAPASTTTSTRQTPSTSTPWSSSSQPPATRSAGSRSSPTAQLDAIPPDGSFRFCDGQRTLEQVLAGLLKHQAHQIEALRSALA